MLTVRVVAFTDVCVAFNADATKDVDELADHSGGEVVTRELHGGLEAYLVGRQVHFEVAVACNEERVFSGEPEGDG